MRIDLGDDEQPEIGLIALIDCIFFLLMFFMVATSFKQKEEIERNKDTELQVTLPTSTVALQRTTENMNPLVIGIDRDGKFYVDGKAVTTEDLHTRLRKVAGMNKGTRIRIDGDRATPYQNIVHVLDLCQFEGLTNIAMNTKS